MPGEADANAHKPADVPSVVSVTLEVHEAVRPDGAETLSVTGPDSPERLVKLRVLLPDDPAVKDT